MKFCVIVVMSSGTGNVLKVQHLLHICSEHYDVKDQVWQPVQCFVHLLPIYFTKWIC